MQNQTKPWGEDIWEDKIKEQGEVGVICGTVGSKKEIEQRTNSTIKFFESEILPSIKKKARILDLGVGPMARLSIALAKKGYDLTGVDISRTTLEIAKKYVDANQTKVKLVQDDITSLKKIHGKFDLIYCIETFEHLPKHLALESLKKFSQLINKKGLVVVEFGLEKRKTIKMLTRNFIYQILVRIKAMFTKTFEVTCHYYSMWEIEDLAKRSGMRIIRRKGGLFIFTKS